MYTLKKISFNAKLPTKNQGKAFEINWIFLWTNMSSFPEPKVALVKDPLYLLDKISLVENPYLSTVNSIIDDNM